MQVSGKHFHTIWLEDDVVKIIDQRWLPHDFKLASLGSAEDCEVAIRDMWVRGAPLIGITAAFGMYLSARNAGKGYWQQQLKDTTERLLATRPTAVNLRWALDQQWKVVDPNDRRQTITNLKDNAQQLKQLEIDRCEQIGVYGLQRLREIKARKIVDGPLNVMTHCNAGWLACIDWGTATAPIYKAHEAGMDIHVWVSETRPRNQGFNITAFELKEAGVPHTLIVDNASGHLMQKGLVDVLITGADRVAANGDTANKIGTYMKALAARESKVPYYVAIPSSSIDFTMEKGVGTIPIEERSESEVLTMLGRDGDETRCISIAPGGSHALNVGFDVTPAGMVEGLITERGIEDANTKSIALLKAP